MFINTLFWILFIIVIDQKVYKMCHKKWTKMTQVQSHGHPVWYIMHQIINKWQIYATA